MTVTAKHGGRNLWTALMLAVFVLGGITESIGQEANNGTRPELTVRLRLDRATYRVGGALSLRITITNDGTEPIIIANDVSLFGNAAARLEINLRDNRGRLSPKTQTFIDTFVAPVHGSSVQAALSSWLLLRPGTSFIAAVPIDASIFPFLAQPGEYTIEGVYSSPGFSYPPANRRLGLSEEDVRAISVPAWSGKIATNKVALRLTAN